MHTASLRLVEPAEELMDSYRSLVAEFIDAGEPLIPFPLGFPNDDAAAFLKTLAECARGEGLASAWVPHSTYWLVGNEGEVVGVSNLRHRLTEKLRSEGGHIGYGVRPSARGNGYSRELLARTLEQARAKGIEAVLLTCSESNVRSVRTIVANDGVREGEAFNAERGDMVQRYWIELPVHW